MTTVSAGSRRRSREKVLRLVRRLRRSRLLMPRQPAPATMARSSSASSWTSTRAWAPARRTASRHSSRAPPSSTATISSTQSAPSTRASAICTGSTVKSLRSTGRSTAARTRSRSAGEPPKSTASVSTEMAAAPAPAYPAATATMSRSGRREPPLGDRRLSSAMIRPPRSASMLRAGGRCSAVAQMAARPHLISSTSCRFRSTMGPSAPRSLIARHPEDDGAPTSSRGSSRGCGSRRRCRWTRDGTGRRQRDARGGGAP